MESNFSISRTQRELAHYAEEGKSGMESNFKTDINSGNEGLFWSDEIMRRWLGLWCRSDCRACLLASCRPVASAQSSTHQPRNGSE